MPPSPKTPLSPARGKRLLTDFPGPTLVSQQSNLHITQIILSKCLATMSLPSLKSSLQVSNALRKRNSNPLAALSGPKPSGSCLPSLTLLTTCQCFSFCLKTFAIAVPFVQRSCLPSLYMALISKSAPKSTPQEFFLTSLSHWSLSISLSYLSICLFLPT